MWSVEELQQLLDELVGAQDPAAVASSVSSTLRVPIQECQKLIEVLKAAFIKWSDTEQERGNRRKRFRRKAAAIERSWFCYVPGCPKSYGTENALKNHFKHKHKNIRFDKTIAQKTTALERDRNDSSELADSAAADESDDEEDERSVPVRASKIRKGSDESPRFYGYPTVTGPGPTNWVPIPHMHMTQIGQPFYAGLPAFPVDLSGGWPPGRPWAESPLLPADAISVQQKQTLPAFQTGIAPGTSSASASSASLLMSTVDTTAPQTPGDPNFRTPEPALKLDMDSKEPLPKERILRRTQRK